MKRWAEELGRAQALLVLSECRNGEGVCESCGVTSVMYWAGTGNECGKCFNESLWYWENRGGFSSEAIFETVGVWRTPKESSRLYRVVMGSYFRTLSEVK